MSVEPGDLVADAEMDLLRDEAGCWSLMSISIALSSKRTLVLGDNGMVRVDERECRAQLRLLAVWMRNIKSQQGM